VALTNTEKQKHWREKRKGAFNALHGSSIAGETAERILAELGVERARKVVRALNKRVRTIKLDCLSCKGTGFIRIQEYLPCTGETHGQPLTSPCDCGPVAAGLAEGLAELQAQACAVTPPKGS
jgi:hypothetical protein